MTDSKGMQPEPIAADGKGKFILLDELFFIQPLIQT